MSSSIVPDMNVVCAFHRPHPPFDPWADFASAHVRLDCTHCGLFQLLVRAWNEGPEEHVETGEVIYSCIADALDDHREECGGFMEVEELRMLHALVAWYRMLAWLDGSAQHRVSWARLFIGGFLHRKLTLPEAEPAVE